MTTKTKTIKSKFKSLNISLQRSSLFSLLLFSLLILNTTGCATKPSLKNLRKKDTSCYNRSQMPYTSIVDSHLHFRPFGGEAIPFKEMISYLEEAGVLFVNIYGIGQMLPVDSSCTYYLNCPGTPVNPTLKNDFVNAANYILQDSQDIHMVLSMTFPDLSRPESILPGMNLLAKEYPGKFTWMGEVNLVKQALFGNGHRPTSIAQIKRWNSFMKVLRKKDIPLAIHSDLGHDKEPTKYLNLFKEVLRLYPHNKIIWMHMGLSKELVSMDVKKHIQIMKSLLNRYPLLMLDISWRVIYDNYFSDEKKRALYVPFLNKYSERILPGSDFVASKNKNLKSYQEDLEVTGRIHRHLNDKAFRNIALGQNYFRLLDLKYTAPAICGQ